MASNRRWHLLLLLIPFAWQVGLAGFANSVRWAPFGVPFEMAWQMAGVVVTSFTLAIVYGIDSSTDRAVKREQVAQDEAGHP